MSSQHVLVTGLVQKYCIEVLLSGYSVCTWKVWIIMFTKPTTAIVNRCIENLSYQAAHHLIWWRERAKSGALKASCQHSESLALWILSVASIRADLAKICSENVRFPESSQSPQVKVHQAPWALEMQISSYNHRNLPININGWHFQRTCLNALTIHRPILCCPSP